MNLLTTQTAPDPAKDVTGIGNRDDLTRRLAALPENVRAEILAALKDGGKGGA